jgi:hypothetical protein
MSIPYTLALSSARPNGYCPCCAPRCLARRPVARKLSVGVKLLCGKFPYPPSYRSEDGIKSVEGCEEADVATEACSLGSWKPLLCARWDGVALAEGLKAAIPQSA